MIFLKYDGLVINFVRSEKLLNFMTEVVEEQMIVI